MKKAVNIARIIVGVLFIFSGLIKAFDPHGLEYKMQEFFEAWTNGNAMHGIILWLNDHALPLAEFMNIFEVGLGVALLIGWQKKFTTWFLLLLMLFFLYLTGYALFTGKVAECGCFGSCIPLSPMGTFVKDIVLLVLILFILIFRKYVLPVVKSVHLVTIMLLSIMATTFLQINALEHLPIVDCLPFKKGNNILELRKMPADATLDKTVVTFICKNGNEEKEFTVDNYPAAPWELVRQKITVIEKGNGKKPLINDFSLNDLNGTDKTDSILGQTGNYYLFFIKRLSEANNNWAAEFTKLYKKAKEQSRPIYVVTSETDPVQNFFNVRNNYNVPVYICDGIAIKTAARVAPTLFLMKGAVIQGKWSWEDIDDAIK